MLLILTTSTDVTADYLAERLAAASVSFVRLDTDTCAERMRVHYTPDAGPSLRVGDRILTLADISNVWLRRPKEIQVTIDGDATERAHVANEWGEAIEGFLAHVPVDRWMNHPTRNVRASHKLDQLTRAREIGLTIPATVVTQERDELARFWHATKGRVIAKPLFSGYLERPDGTVASIYTNRVLEEHLASDAIAACPTLFQEEVAKDFDVRVTAVDGRFTAVAMRRKLAGSQIVDVRRDNMEGVEYEVITMPSDVEHALRNLLSSYELRFAAVDFAVALNGTWVFFEINPNGQWAWFDLDGVTSIWEDFAHAFYS
jgi:hypothetical protein